MNLNMRIGEMLQGRFSGAGGDAGESVAMVVQQRAQEDAQRTHMRRLFMARVQELEELRIFMRRQRRPFRDKDSPRHSSGRSPMAATRPPGGVDASQLISLINELEVKILSEPMGLTGVSREKCEPVAAIRDEAVVAHNATPVQAHPLDDPALMVAARRWNSAADLLIKAMRSGDLPHSPDWATRSAIDLFERGGRSDRADAIRAKYRQNFGREPVRLLPPPLTEPMTGRLQVSGSMRWTCPRHLDAQAGTELRRLLSDVEAGGTLLMDWSLLESVQPEAIDAVQLWLIVAIRSRHVFVHVALSRLIRTVRLELKARSFPRQTWELWLAVLNFTGFRTAHHTAAVAYARRFQCEAPAFLNLTCVCHPLQSPPAGSLDHLVGGVRLMGDLTQVHAEQLDRLDMRAPSPGRLVVLDLRRLVSMDFFFAADLLNWIIRRHTCGEAVAIAYAHPLLSHFLQMLGLQNYAKVHGLPARGLAE